MLFCFFGFLGVKVMLYSQNVSLGIISIIVLLCLENSARKIVMNHYDHKIKKKAIDKNDLGELLVNAKGVGYLPSRYEKNIKQRVIHYLDNCLTLMPFL